MAASERTNARAGSRDDRPARGAAMGAAAVLSGASDVYDSRGATAPLEKKGGMVGWWMWVWWWESKDGGEEKKTGRKVCLFFSLSLS